LEVFLKIENWEIEVEFAGAGASKNEYLNNMTLREFYPDYKTDEAGIMQSLRDWEMRLSSILDSIHDIEKWHNQPSAPRQDSKRHS